MGVYKDITGQKFNRLTALERDIEATKFHSDTYWKCQCDCGNVVSVGLQRLQKGKTKSCGCYRKEVACNNTKKNLVGQKFGRLTVIKESDQRKNNRITWECQCECGNIVYVNTNDLTTGNTKSCGCYHKEQVSNLVRRDLTNQRFGKLIALYPTDKRVDNKVVWHCKCDCGNECKIASTGLTSGRTSSCGCIRYSIGEEHIVKILEDNSINYQREYKFADLGNLRYDFYLPNYNRLIEFDGEQHYRDSGWGLAYDVKQRDQIKNDYAKLHNIQLVRIPYWERDKLTLDLLLGDKYLI